MKRYVLSLIYIVSLCVGFASAENVQKGYVKTRGRLSSEGKLISGERLPDVVIDVKDGNTVLSNAKGDFSITLLDEEYCFTNIIKPGYELIDGDELWRNYRYSQNPHIIVLDTPTRILEDKLVIERKIRKNLQSQLDAKIAEVEQLKQDNKLTQEDYLQQLQQIYNNQESNEKLIGEMSERYSSLDFDVMDKLNLRISDCIINGRLVEADSILRTKGSIHSRAQEIRKLQEANRVEESEISKRQKRLEKSKQLVKRNIDDLAQDCYSKFEIFKLQYKMDSAAYYLKYRAKLDTLNAEWQIDASVFIVDYIADYSEALSILNNSLATIEVSEENASKELKARIYNCIGTIYQFQGNYAKALDYFLESLELKEQIWGTEHLETSITYNNIGAYYRSRRKYDEALKYYLKAFKIRQHALGENHELTATSYNNIGEVYASMRNYPKAIDNIQKSIEIKEHILGSNHISVATSYNNLGTIYSSLKDYDKAHECYKKAIDIRKEILGDNHPSTAVSYNNLGELLSKQRNYADALINFNKAIAGFSAISGVNNHKAGTAYGHIGIVYMKQGDYTQALQNFVKSSAILENTLGAEHLETASSYLGTARIYTMLKDYDKALEYYNKVLLIFEKRLGPTHRDTLLIKTLANQVSDKLSQ